MRFVRVKERSVAERTPTWQTVFCSLVMIVLTFFIMMTAWSQFEVRKMAYARLAVSPTKKSLKEVKKEIERLAEEIGQGGLITIHSFEGGFRAVFATPLLFPAGRAELDPSAHLILKGIAKVSKNASFFISVEGHTDSSSLDTAKFSSPWELSALRAVNVIRYLHQEGIPLDRLSAVGFGDTRPVASNSTEEGRQKNRRIEIVFSEEVS
ncbi:MAG: OmpA family protein [Syntrophales bacterium]|nr:OmpA family protein [Syntrophales bacterium]